MKRVLSLLVASMLALSLVACGNQNTINPGSASSSSANPGSASGGESLTSTDKTYKIAMIHQDLSTEFETYANTVIRARAQELGVDLIYFDGQGSVDVQMRLAENAIQQQVDLIMFTPQDKSGCAPIVDKCNEAGIPIMCVITDTDNVEDATASVGAAHIESGIMEMEYIAEKLGGQGNICIIQGPYGHAAQLARQEGIMQVLEKYPDIKVLQENTANWDRTQAMALTENWLQKDADKIDAIVCHSDDMGMGALQAIQAANMGNDIIVIGVDGIIDALHSVQDGGMVATVFQDVFGIGESAIDVALQILNGESFQKTTHVPFKLVTQDNVEEFLKNFE